jgi:hypothetical protein
LQTLFAKSFAFRLATIILARCSIRHLNELGEAMKPYVLGAICVWFICGIAGAMLLGQRRVDIPTIAGGPITLWNGLNKPVGN